jgi:hypothetical protein
MGIITEGRTKIVVIETDGVNYCVAVCDGQKMHNRIAAFFCENRNVELSFSGISDLTPVFSNSSAGQLYWGFPAESNEDNLSFNDISREDEIILRRVIEREKTYLEHAYSLRKAIMDLPGGEDA